MYSVNELLKTLEEYAPLTLSAEMIKVGAYDNSGLLIKTHDEVKKVLFSVDLSESVIARAKRLGADTVITHHPAIYTPIKSVDEQGENRVVALAIKSNLNVISMHLNLDICDKGIDFSLATKLGAKSYRIINLITAQNGYGREFSVGTGVGFSAFTAKIKKDFGSKKVLSYGSKNAKVSVVASFCGAGSSDAVEYIRAGGKADTIVTSDCAHHHIKEILENGKKLVIIPHYVAEEVGFNAFYEWTKERLPKNLSAEYFVEKIYK